MRFATKPPGDAGTRTGRLGLPSIGKSLLRAVEGRNGVDPPRLHAAQGLGRGRQAGLVIGHFVRHAKLTAVDRLPAADLNVIAATDDCVFARHSTGIFKGTEPLMVYRPHVEDTRKLLAGTRLPGAEPILHRRRRAHHRGPSGLRLLQAVRRQDLAAHEMPKPASWA